MCDDKQSRTRLDEQDVRRLADSLGEYALTLPEAERHVLFKMLLRAMEPLDRYRYLETSDLLSATEQEALNSLEKESTGG